MNIKSKITSTELALPTEVIYYIKEKLSEIFKERLKQLILFGSYARGNLNDESDVDLLLITSNKLTFEEKEKLTEIELYILTNYNLFISIIPESEKFINDYSWIPFYQNIEKEGIILYG